MIRPARALGVLLLAAAVAGAQAPSGSTQNAQKPAKAKHRTQAQLESDLEQLNEKYEQLEKEMQQMKADAERRETELKEAAKRAATAQAEVDMANQQQRARAESTLETVAKANQDITTLQGAVADIKATSSSLAETIQADQQKASAPVKEIPFLGIGIRPGGFLAAETVDRQRGIGGDVNTQFAGIPFAGSTAGRLSEFNASGRQSRVTLLAEGRMSHSTLRGYYEADFLSAGSTSNDNQSNSYTLRQRQVWAQADLKSGWIFTGGQMWSLATEYKSGLMNLKEQIPLTIDAQYNVGFTWARQYGFRVIKNIHNRVSAGFAIEEPQTLNLGGHNLPALVYQQAGNSGGLYNPGANYSFNPVPDLVGKVAFDPGFGHYEIFGVGRFFRARAYPNEPFMLVTTQGSQSGWGPQPGTATTTGAFTAKTSGGGLGANARVPLLWNRIEIGAHALAGNGIGRYSSSTLADATAHPDGTLELLSGGSAMGTLEIHATPRFDLYSYYGGEYVKRAFYATGFTVPTAPTSIYFPPQGQPILGGYGAPTNIVFGCNIEPQPASSANGGGDVPGSLLGCTADNRNIQEGTLGYWFRFYKGSKGTLQQGIQYSYLIRHTWQGVGLAADPVTGALAIPGSPKAIDNMIFTSFRYYLPQ